MKCFFWQFVADTRSTVLGWAPPCSDVSKQLLLSHFPFSCFAENHHHHAKMDGTLSINPCARSCHSVPPDTSFSPPHPTPGSGRLTVIDRINTSCLRLLTVRPVKRQAGGLACFREQSVPSQDPECYKLLLNPVLSLEVTLFLCGSLISGVSLSFPVT